MATKLFVGSISFQSTDESLHQAFSQAGTVVSATIMKDKFTGRSRGFGFVEMDSEESAKAAIDMWNGKELDGRSLIVNEARPLEDRPPRRSFGGGGGGRSFGGGGGNRGGGDHRGGGRNDRRGGYGNSYDQTGGRDW